MWLTAGVIIAALTIMAGSLWIAGVGQDRRSADERLAEIEAARALLDSENAATIYNELLQDPNATAPLSYVPKSVDGQTVSRVSRQLEEIYGPDPNRL